MSVNVVVIGLGFGRDFLPIYLDHPDVGDVAVAEPNASTRAEVAAAHGVAATYATLDDALDDDHWNAVHLCTPVRFHATQSQSVLNAGRHCACAVPMASSIDDLRAVVAAADAADRVYMMMETSAYSREFLTADDLYRRGDLGEITLYRGAHIQNLEGFPTFWLGFPPMWYLTHALSPALALLDDSVATVRALGSGRLQPHQTGGGYDNEFATEVGLFELRDHDVVAEITMSFFRVGRRYHEGFDVYGDEMGLEWPDEPDGPLRGHRLQPLSDADPSGTTWPIVGRGRAAELIDVPTSTFAERLPESIRRYTNDFDFTPADGGPTVRRPAEHGGSHPHLVHEFIASIVEDRRPAIDHVRAAQWTAPGLVAHQSALAGGTPMEVPHFE